MKKTIAIPAYLLKENLTAEEQAELSQYGDQPMTTAEISDRQAEESAHAAAQPRLDILSQIAKLEAQQTPRRMREALTDPTFINDLNAQIAVLRGQL